MPDAPTDPVRNARVLILKDEAGRKDKIYLYDSHGTAGEFAAGHYSPGPRRVSSIASFTS